MYRSFSFRKSGKNVISLVYEGFKEFESLCFPGQDYMGYTWFRQDPGIDSNGNPTLQDHGGLLPPANK
ncbi:MAG: hypothetical protein U0W65_12310 [Bacteroidia bacterium]